MKISFVGLVALLAICYGCGTGKKPSGVLSKEKLVEFLVETHVAEARMTGVSVPADSAKKLFRPFEIELLKKMGVSDSVMKLTYRYYVDHPMELEAVYDVVIDTLSLREQKEGLKKK